MKKSFFIVLSVILCVLCFPIIVKADEPDNTKYSAGNFYYHVHEGYVSVCGYVGDDTEIIIPSNIAGSPVSEIESKAFDGCDTIETITIPETVDTLYDDSFLGMTSLKKVICNTINVNINVGDGIEVEYTSVLQGNDDNTSKQQGNDETVENPDNKPDKETVNNTGEDTDNGSKDDKSENSDIGEYSYEETDDDANTNSEKATNPENSTNTGNTTNTDVNSSDNVTTLTPANNDSTTIDSIDAGSNKTETNDQTIVTSEDGTTQVAEGTGLLISTSDSEKAANNDTTTVVTGNKKIWVIIIPIAIVIAAIVVSIVLFTKSNKN